MANDHPFQMLFETLGRVPAAHAESVNRQAYEILSDILSVPVEKTGRCILLRAPRAGHGKTHLLSRIQHQLGASHEFIPLHAAFGCRIDAASVIDDTLRRLVRHLPASGGLTVLDLITRRLFASALQPLVGSGEVPCQDREGALTALRARPIETFDFNHPSAVTAHWARENFEVLGQRLSLELAQRAGLPVREVGFWVDALFRYAASPLENSNRVRLLAENVHAESGGDMERLQALLGLLTLLMRVVLVADDLEGFSADETAALRLAAFLGSLRQSVERLDVVLSLNQDIWQSAFLPRLSGGLADRLSEVVVELEPLKESEMAALLDSRVPGLGSRVLDRIDVGSSGTHARGLIRAAGIAWLKATAMDSAPPVVAPSVFAIPTPANEPSAPPESLPAESVAPEPVAFEAPPAPEPPSLWPSPDFQPAPEPEEIVEEPLVYQVPVQSPFQTETPVWERPSSEAFESPFSNISPPVIDIPAEQAPVDSPAEDSPFRAATTPEPLAYTQDPPAFMPPPPVVSSSEQPLYNPPSDTPFQAAPEVPVFNPPAWQEPHADYFQAPSEPPFQKAPPEPPFQPLSEPVIPAAPLAEPLPLPTAADTDRVDDLLRQFRERYGRGSL